MKRSEKRGGLNVSQLRSLFISLSIHSCSWNFTIFSVAASKPQTWSSLFFTTNTPVHSHSLSHIHRDYRVMLVIALALKIYNVNTSKSCECKCACRSNEVTQLQRHFLTLLCICSQANIFLAERNISSTHSLSQKKKRNEKKKEKENEQSHISKSRVWICIPFSTFYHYLQNSQPR